MHKTDKCGMILGVEEKVEELLGEVMVDTGTSITITTLTNVLAFAVGAFTPTPEIQLFSIGNALAITIDFIYEWSIFGSMMAIVGRWELSERTSNGSETNSIDGRDNNSIPISNCSRKLQERLLSKCSKWVKMNKIIHNPKRGIYYGLWIELVGELHPQNLRAKHFIIPRLTKRLRS